MTLVAFAFALVMISLLVVALLIGPSSPPEIDVHETDDAPTDQEVEQRVREELYGRRLNVSRR